jgi:hypothetical protein
MCDTIFEAENAKHRIVVTCEPEDCAYFDDLQPNVKVRYVHRDEYDAISNFNPDAHAAAMALVTALASFDVDIVTFRDGHTVDVYNGTYDFDGTTFELGTDYGNMFVLPGGDRIGAGYAIGEVDDPADYGDFELFKAHCQGLFSGDIGVYYVKATVWEKCGSCNTWHHVVEDSIGYVVDTPDIATWQNVAHNALRAAGLPHDTFTF